MWPKLRVILLMVGLVGLVQISAAPAELRSGKFVCLIVCLFAFLLECLRVALAVLPYGQDQSSRKTLLLTVILTICNRANVCNGGQNVGRNIID